MVLSGVTGLVWQLLRLLREEGATHVGCATDHVIESWRNDRYPGYKSSAGMAPELLAQFPIAEQAIEALGIVCWPMVEWEADDALATACARWGDDAEVDGILVCTPDKDMAQLVRDARIVLRDRRRDITYDEDAVVGKWGVRPTSIPDWLALVGDAADGYPGIPGWGAKSAAAVLAKFGSIPAIPMSSGGWGLAGLRGVEKLAVTLRDQFELALLFRRIATVETDVEVGTVDDWQWRGPTDEFAKIAERIGAPHLVERAKRLAERTAPAE